MNTYEIKEKLKSQEYDFLRTDKHLGDNIICSMQDCDDNIKIYNCSGIYAILNIINKKVYIGSAKNLYNRYRKHKSGLNNNIHPNKHMQNSYNKYGACNFLFVIIEIVDDENKLIEKEQHWIDTYQSYNNRKGYNIRIEAQSNLGLKLSEETKIKMSEAHKGENAYWFNKTMHPNFIKAGQIARKNRKYTDEQRDKVSKQFKGTTKSQDTIEKMKEAQKGSNNPSAKLNEEKVKEIILLLNKKISMKEIAEMFKVSYETISSIKRGLIWKNVPRIKGVINNA